jgi:uncharacterized protein (TIGR02611 family)
MVRIARIGAGIGLVILGLFLLVLPGPGIITIAAGLAVLSVDFVWAANLLDWFKDRYRKYFTKEESEAPEDAADELVSNTDDYEGG